MNDRPSWSYHSVLPPEQLTKQLPGIKTLELSGIKYRLIWDKVTTDAIKLIACPPGQNVPGLHLKGTIQGAESGSFVQFREPLLRNEILLVVAIWTALGAFVCWFMWSTIIRSSTVALVLLTVYLIITLPPITLFLFRWCRTRRHMKTGLGLIFLAEPAGKLQ